MSKDEGGLVEEVFTPTGKCYQVNVKVKLYDLKQALALRSIISSFQTSAIKRERRNGKYSVSSTSKQLPPEVC